MIENRTALLKHLRGHGLDNDIDVCSVSKPLRDIWCEN
jgi:hypothetical protein